MVSAGSFVGPGKGNDRTNHVVIYWQCLRLCEFNLFLSYYCTHEALGIVEDPREGFFRGDDCWRYAHIDLVNVLATWGKVEYDIAHSIPTVCSAAKVSLHVSPWLYQLNGEMNDGLQLCNPNNRDGGPPAEQIN
jgi:hypothetical protein